MIRSNLTIDRRAIADFCQRHHIRWLAIFGSALRDDFRPESDVDVLVEFEPGHTPGLAFFGLPDELSPLFGDRQIDLITKKAVNRWIRDRVLAEAEVIYDAT